MATLSPLIISFNCGRELVKSQVFARHLIQNLSRAPTPELIVLSLQEVAPISYAFLGGSLLAAYFKRFDEAVKVASKAWNRHDGQDYVHLITRNVGMTALMVYVRTDVTDRVRWIEEGGTGVGWYETGNKGCVGVRLGYEVASAEVLQLTFLAAHLAPMEDMLEKRNQDWQDIIISLVFSKTREKISQLTEEQAPLLGNDERQLQAGIYTATSYLFLAGDLNYRTSSTRPLVEDLIAFPRPDDKFDSLHYTDFLKRDQLQAELEAGKTFHGFKEPLIRFPPTYKYSDEARAAVGKHEDSPDDISGHQSSFLAWASHRWPSWCDRILYLDIPPWMKASDPSLTITPNLYTALPLMSTSDHRPVAMSLTIPLKAIPSPPERYVDDVRMSPPFAIDSNWSQRRAAARRKELAIGLISYLGLTWEGNTVLLATLIGAVGGWAIIRSMLME